MSRGYSNYSEFESYDDGRLNTSYAVTGYADHVCRPAVVNAEERRNPIIRHTQANNSEGFVMKAERVAEHVARAPVINIVMANYNYGSPEKEDMLKEDMFKEYGSTYDRPEKVENFLTKIQIEVSQPNKPSVPFNTNWRARPRSTDQYGNSATKYGYDKDFIQGTNQKKIYSIPIGDKQNEGYPPISQRPNSGNTNKYNFNERPNEGPTVPSRPLSRPTNDINDAEEFSTEGIKTLESDVNKPTKPGNWPTNRWRNVPNFSTQNPKFDAAGFLTESDVNRQTKPGNLATQRWHNGYNFSVQGPKLDQAEFLTEDIKTLDSDVNRPTKPGNLATNRWSNGPNFSAQGPKLDAVGFLTGGIKTLESDVNSPTKPGNLATNRWRNGSTFPAQGPKLDAAGFLTEDIKTYESDVNWPTKPGNLATNRWSNASNFSAQGPELDSGDDDLEMFKEPKMYSSDNFEKYYQSEAANPINNSKYDGRTENLFGQTTSFPGISQQPRFTVPPNDANSYPETIDSNEAKKRYSKLKPQPLSEEPYSGAINSDELIKKYNGAKVPR